MTQPTHQSRITSAARLAPAIVAACFSCTVASGANYEFTFHGVVDTIDPATTGFANVFDQTQLGDPFVLRYVFNSETPDLMPGPSIGSATGWYAMLELGVTVGAAQADAFPASIVDGLIRVVNDSPSDLYTSGAVLPVMIASSELVALVELEDPTAGALTNDLLPTTLALDDWSGMRLVIEQAGSFVPPAVPRLYVSATITGFESRIVPEPSAAWISSALGLALLAARRRTDA